MKKISSYLLIFTFIFLSAACSKSSEEKPAGDSNKNSSDDAALSEKLTANKWNMLFNGQSYGTIRLNVDGTCIKTNDSGGMETIGTWKLESGVFTLSFPSEGDPFSGSVNIEGDNLIVKFLDGAITYTYTPAEG
jgi:hypothetical protein